jgi:hypothetical protein
MCATLILPVVSYWCKNLRSRTEGRVQNENTGFEILAEITVKRVTFWDVRPCSVVEFYHIAELLPSGSSSSFDGTQGTKQRFAMQKEAVYWAEFLKKSTRQHDVEF